LIWLFKPGGPNDESSDQSVLFYFVLMLSLVPIVWFAGGGWWAAPFLLLIGVSRIGGRFWIARRSRRRRLRHEALMRDLEVGRTKQWDL
jgi:hypothetical protein